jgi:hypothetical protein
MRNGVKWDILNREGSDIGNDLKYARRAAQRAAEDGRVPFQIIIGINEKRIIPVIH